MMAGDVISEINGVATENLSHMEAQNHIKNAGSTLQLKVRYETISSAIFVNFTI